jgi:flagellar biosynthesis/type III secretory pathway protein FliH
MGEAADSMSIEQGGQTSRVLKAQRVESELEIAQRRSEAAQLVEQARSSASQMLNFARETGLEEGRQAVTQALMEDVRRIVTDFNYLIRRREDALAGVVMQAVKTIIGEMPPQERVRKVISAALADLLDSFTIILKVAAEDLTMVRGILTRLQEEGQAQNVVSVVVDPLLGAGEMLIETERGRVHIGLEQQMSRLRAALMQAAQPRP